MVREKLGNPVL